ncbi:MAG: AraC family transcriptional regulator [Eubacteriales bacterium]|nr:AraC family transcriptional regulator [Eubacteriales bacterium]
MAIEYQHTYEGLRQLGLVETESSGNFPPRGRVFTLSSEQAHLRYWLYEGQDFFINIHDFDIFEDLSFHFDCDASAGSHTTISIIKEACGDVPSLQRNLESGMVMAYHRRNTSFHGILHAGSKFSSVGLEYKDGFFDQKLSKQYDIKLADIEAALANLNHGQLFPQLLRIADEILLYREDSPMCDFFYETKSKEIVSLILKDYYDKRNALKSKDIVAIENVANMINEHYMMTLSLDFLAGIALMSKSKLKDCFKAHYGMTISEYTQRRRIYVAEHLLMTTDLSIANIAKAVGYKSHSRFSALFQRYQGQVPTEYLAELRQRQRHIQQEKSKKSKNGEYYVEAPL